MPVDMGGCGYYRVRQPLRMLKQYTVHDTHVINIKEDDVSSIGMALARSDVAIVRQGGEDGMRQLKQFSEFKKVKWVLDIDDNIELISHIQIIIKNMELKSSFMSVCLYGYRDSRDSMWTRIRLV